MKKLLLLLIPLILLTGCKEKEEQIQKQDFDSKDQLSEKIDMRSTVINDTLILFLTNNNEETVDIEIKIDFYNKNDKLVDTAEDIYSAFENKKELALPFIIYEDYKYYKINLSTNKTEYTSHEDKLNITEKKNDQSKVIEFDVKNNAKDKIEYLEITVVYYNNGYIVGVESEYGAGIEPNENTLIKIGYPLDGEYKDIIFDDYKIYINEACSYNKEIRDER